MEGSLQVRGDTSGCEQCPVRNIAICRALRGSHWDELSGINTRRRYSKGDAIVQQDSSSQLFAIIVSGVVKLTRMNADGRLQIVGLLFESDCLGDIFREHTRYGAECVNDVELCCFQSEAFDEVLKGNPALEHNLLERVTGDLEDARRWIALLGKMKATEKVATFLLWLRNKKCHHCSRLARFVDNNILEPPLTREEIAEVLGLTRETVSRIMHRMTVERVIERVDRDSIKIKDLAALRRLSGSNGFG